MKKHRISKGNLVKVYTGTNLDRIMDAKGIPLLATVLECRYKSDVFLIALSNSNINPEPYWCAGRSLVALPAA